MESTGSSLEIDIVIPTAYKDIRVLPLCIRGIRECIEDSVKDIYVISADNEEIRKICDDNDCILIDEVMLMGFSPSDRSAGEGGQTRPAGKGEGERKGDYRGIEWE